LVGSGETYEWLVDFSQTSALAPTPSPDDPSGVTAPKYPVTGGAAGVGVVPGTQTRYVNVVPIPNPNLLVLNRPVSNTLTQFPAIPVPLALQPFTYIAGETTPLGRVGVVQGLWGPTNLSAPGPGTLPPNIPIAAANAQVFPFHNHDDYKATNNGVYPGGQFTALIPQP
jgi:hypothetical protein